MVSSAILCGDRFLYSLRSIRCPFDLYCCRSTVPTAAAARYVVQMNKQLFNASVAPVVLILCEPASTGLMSSQRFRRGLAEPNVHCF